MSGQPIILGGGLAGLSACYHGDGIIYEKTQKTGGHASSHEKVVLSLMKVFMLCILKMNTY